MMARSPRGSTRTTIAVVDDDAGVRNALHTLLRSMGFEAVTFGSAEAFLAERSCEDIDCLIVDLHLPGMNGVALVQELADCGTPLPAILITAHADPDSLKLIRQIAPTPHLTKPFSDAELSEALRCALSA